MREKEERTKIIFIRHGKTIYPEDRLYGEKDDPELSPEGIEQSQRIAQWIAKSPIDLLFVSPLRRTRETAEPIARALNLVPVVKSELKERFFGIWEGLDFSEIKKKYSEDFRKWKEDPVYFKPENGESIKELNSRVNKFIRYINKNYPFKTIVLVTHVGTIRVALSHALGIPLKNYRILNIPFGSASRVDYGTNQNNLIYSSYTPSYFS